MAFVGEVPLLSCICLALMWLCAILLFQAELWSSQCHCSHLCFHWGGSVKVPFFSCLESGCFRFTYDHKFELSWSAGHSSQLVQSKTSLCNWESYWLIHQQANCDNNHIHFLLQPVIAALWWIWKVCQIFSSWHMDAFFSLRCCITSNFVCYVLVWFCVVQK